MLTALILVCSLASVPDLGDCTRDNALDVMHVPATFANPVTCFMHGQAYVADSSIGRDLAPNEAVKVICVRNASGKVDKAETRP
jgi:hypothetical protein